MGDHPRDRGLQTDERAVVRRYAGSTLSAVPGAAGTRPVRSCPGRSHRVRCPSRRWRPNSTMETTGTDDIQAVDLETLLRREGLPPECVLVPFSAHCRGERVNVLAVLQRTAVVHPARLEGDPQNRALVRRSEVIVERAAIRTRPMKQGSWGWPPRSGSATADVRRCSRCRRPEGQAVFPEGRSSCCRSCHRELSREWRRRTRQVAA